MVWDRRDGVAAKLGAALLDCVNYSCGSVWKETRKGGGGRLITSDPSVEITLLKYAVIQTLLVFMLLNIYIIIFSTQI